MTFDDTPAEILFEKIMDFMDNLCQNIQEDSIWAWLVVTPLAAALYFYLIVFDRCRHLFSGMDLDEHNP